MRRSATNVATPIREAFALASVLQTPPCETDISRGGVQWKWRDFRGLPTLRLITGERGGISESTNQAFRDSGLFHILSISGLHMVIMAGAVFFCIRLALAAIPVVALRYPIKKWAAAGAMIGAFGYLMISDCDKGFS